MWFKSLRVCFYGAASLMSLHEKMIRVRLGNLGADRNPSVLFHFTSQPAPSPPLCLPLGASVLTSQVPSHYFDDSCELFRPWAFEGRMSEFRTMKEKKKSLAAHLTDTTSCRYTSQVGEQTKGKCNFNLFSTFLPATNVWWLLVGSQELLCI